MEIHLTTTECHLPYGITQCYLLPDTSEHTPPVQSVGRSHTVPLAAQCAACIFDSHFFDTVKKFRRFVFSLCLWLLDTYLTAKVSEEVNRKLPARNTTAQVQPFTPILSATIHSVIDEYRQTDRQTDGRTDIVMPRADHVCSTIG